MFNFAVNWEIWVNAGMTLELPSPNKESSLLYKCQSWYIWELPMRDSYFTDKNRIEVYDLLIMSDMVLNSKYKY